MRYTNPSGGSKGKISFCEWIKFQCRRITDYSTYKAPHGFIIPNDKAKMDYATHQNVDTITWIGHSSTLIKLDGKTILTDPFFSDFASPMHGIGPKRFTPPGLALVDLPEINIIIISHNHYDHLDLKSLSSIKNKESITIIVPLNMGQYLKKLGYKIIYELNWYDHINIHDITIRALPSYHSSGRNLVDYNKHLWANFMFSSPNITVFFDGNTGYGSVFSEIGREFGPFDYALISIGAYQPQSVLHHNHISPEYTIKLAQDIGAKKIIPIHWGTLILSDESPFEPPKALKKAAIAAKYPLEDLWILNIGETRKL